MAILPWDSAAAKCCAELGAELKRTGRTLSALDLMIAAHALATGTVLVSSDQALQRVAGLKVEDWTAGPR